METKANYTIVGFFTLLVIAAAFGFVYWMAEYGRGGPMVELVVRIPGSANGLSVGSPVRFNGIQVGSVQGLSIDADDPNYSLAFTQVRADAPVYTSTKAILEIQGLTGAAYIELSGGRNGDENILKRSIDTGKRAVLLADQSSVTNLLTTADKILNRANDTIGDIQGFISDSRGPLTDTVRNAQKFSKAIADNSDNIDKFLASVGQLSDTFKTVSVRVDSTLDAVEKLVRAVDAQKVNDVIANADKITANVADATQQTLDRVDQIVASIDPAKVKGSVDDVAEVTKQARAAVASIRDVANSVAAHQQDIDQTIANARDISTKLNAASGKVDGILTKVDSLLGNDSTQSLFAEAKDTLESFKKMADNLNSRIGPIADNLQRFSSTGLRDAQSLINDMRGTVDNLNTTITNFDKNPQRLIFGGDTVKTYDGRARH